MSLDSIGQGVLPEVHRTEGGATCGEEALLGPIFCGLLLCGAERPCACLPLDIHFTNIAIYSWCASPLLRQGAMSITTSPSVNLSRITERGIGRDNLSNKRERVRRCWLLEMGELSINLSMSQRLPSVSSWLCIPFMKMKPSPSCEARAFSLCWRIVLK